MAIWTYRESASHKEELGDMHLPSRAEQFELTTRCSYCTSQMDTLATCAPTFAPRPSRLLPSSAYKGMNENVGFLLGCPVCGWWSASSVLARAPYETHDGGFAELRCVPGVLKNLNIADLSIPNEELRTYLVARYADRFGVHPKKYEEIVAGVFSDFGFRVRVTSFSGDEGIDLFVLDADDNTTVGVQVKRYKGAITAEQIRSFVGALVLQGLTTGIYVTTSSYQRGAQRTAAAASERLGIGIKLLDARRFYEALQITTRASHWHPDDPSAPYYQCWSDLKDYLEGFSRPGWLDRLGRPWLDTAGYVWGSGW